MTGSSAAPTATFREVADRVWVARLEWCATNVTVVGGAAGLLVVDTYVSSAAARPVARACRQLSSLPLLGLVNTHEHFDHTFGNAVFREEFGPVPIRAHDEAAARTVAAGERIKAEYADQPADQPADLGRDDVLATPIVPADQTFSSVHVLDLGDRVVELVHPGKGHTGGDLVCRVGDAGVLLAGDLVEESGPPAYGGDCHPLDWPASLDLVLGLLGPDDVIVPGHGVPVGRDFVLEQRADIGVVAETIRDLAGRGVPVEDAVASAEWPFPADGLVEACRRGYEQLPRSARRLPLI